MSQTTRCPDCHSIKIFPGIDRGDGKCAKCYGTGSAGFIDSAIESLNILNDQRPKCSICHGSGVCQSCGGTGCVSAVVNPVQQVVIIEEHRRRRIPIPHDLVGCALWIVGAVAIVFVVATIVMFSVLTVIVSMPIWVEAVAVSVITGYLYGKRRVREISADRLLTAPVIQFGIRRRKFRVDPDFVKAQIRWYPDMLVVGGAGVLYATLVGSLLVIFNADKFGKIMFGIAILGGSVLSWKSGRKVLEWRISEAVLVSRNLATGGPTTASQVAFGLSIAASAVLLVLIGIQAVNAPSELRQQQTRLAPQPTTQSSVQARNTPSERAPMTFPESHVKAPSAALQHPSSTPREPSAVQATPPLTFSAVVSADTMSRFVNQMMELEKSQQLDAIMNNYAPRVKYFDHGLVDHSFIRNDKADYFARWPSISYTSTGELQIEQASRALWTARAPLKFHVVNQRGEWIDGDVTQILTIDTSRSTWLITEEQGVITRREKGTGPPPTEPSGNVASSGSSQAIGGGAFRGKGTVYKIPDLKTLAGKPLSNAWLYGEFAFEKQQGNVAVCRTAATFLFIGKGTTRVNIEFAGGFSVSDRILASMRDPQLPLTYTLRTPPNNPIRLLRVRQTAGGTLEVFASSPITLDMR